jgi:creatinine amidohydrolase
VYNGHGGNTHLLHFLAQSSLWEQKPYSLYMPTAALSPEQWEQWQAMRESSFGGHACEFETSLTLGNYPDLVHMDRVPDQPAQALERLRHLPPTFTGIGWYSNHPEHYAGDARQASAQKGRALVGWMVDMLAAYIAAVKADEVVPALESEFFARAGQVTQDTN